MTDFTGKVAIVTGGATSIGATIVRALHGEGARVVIADIESAAGKVLAKRLGEGAMFQRTDVESDEDIIACVAATVAAFGGIDILVNNACSFLDKGLQSSREEWHRALDVNIVGGAVFVREAAPHMRRRGGGAIVNFSSIAGKHGQRGRALYPAAKAAILQLTRNEAMELAAGAIRVKRRLAGLDLVCAD